MTMPTPTETPLLVRITNHLPLVEKVLILTLAVGMVLTFMQIDLTVTRLAMVGLAVIFFLLAYRPLEIPDDENQQGGFSELLAWIIVPKVLWISCAVSAAGIALYLLHLGNEGYKQMLMIGGSSIAMATLILVFLALSGLRHMRALMPVLLRALPLLLADIYIFLK